jgi:hypothetical protein
VDQGAGRRSHRRSRKFHQGLIADLLEFAEREFELDARQPDGSTLREHGVALARRGNGEPPAALASLECPDVVRYLWGYFQDMSTRRTSNGYTVNPLSHQEVQAWAARRGLTIEVWESQALDQLESLYLLAVTRERA